MLHLWAQLFAIAIVAACGLKPGGEEGTLAPNEFLTQRFSADGVGMLSQPAGDDATRNAAAAPYTIIDLKWPPASERAQEPFQGVILKPHPDTPSFVLTFGFPVITLSHQDDLRTMLSGGGPYMAFQLSAEGKWTQCSLAHWREVNAQPLLIPRLHTNSVEAKRPSARDALRAIAAALRCEIQDNDGHTLDWSPDLRFAALCGFVRNKDDSRNKGDEKDFVTLYALIHDTKTSKNYVCTLSSSTRIFGLTGGWPEDSSVYAVLNWVPFTQSVYFVSPPLDILPDSTPIAPDEASKEPTAASDATVADITAPQRAPLIGPALGSIELPMVAQLETVAQLGPDQLQWSISVADPTATKLLIRLAAHTQGFEWSLDRKNNPPVTAASIKAVGGGVLTSAPDAAGANAFPGISAVPGAWNTFIVCPADAVTTLRLSRAAGAPDAEFPVNVHLTFVGSPVKIATVPSRTHAKVGTQVAVSTAVFNDMTPIPGAQIRATATGPSGQIIGIDLLDNGDADNASDLEAGDGLYSGSFTPDQDGDWTISATAQVPVASPSVTRTSVTHVDIYPNDIALLRGEPVAAKCVIDPASNLLQHIETTVQVDAARACNAMIAARFTLSPSGRPLDARSYLKLKPGLNSVTLSVPAVSVKKVGYEGEIAVTEVSAHTGEAGEFLADSWRPSPTTPCRISMLSFPGQDVEVLPGCTSRTEDRNNNGKPDHLVIDVPLAVRVAGLYTCQSELRTDDGWSAGNIYSTFDLPRSPRHVVSFAFPAGAFSRKGRDGPFRLDGMIFSRSDGGTSMTHNVICWIDAVDASQFDDYVPCADRNRNGVCDEREPSSGDKNSDGIPDDTPNAHRCLRIADLVGDQPGSGPDGCANQADMNAFMAAYESGSLLADVSSQDGEPDGLLTQIDLDTFLIAYQECAGNCGGGSVP